MMRTIITHLETSQHRFRYERPLRDFGALAISGCGRSKLIIGGSPVLIFSRSFGDGPIVWAPSASATIAMLLLVRHAVTVANGCRPEGSSGLTKDKWLSMVFSHQTIVPISCRNWGPRSLEASMCVWTSPLLPALVAELPLIDR